MALVAGVVFFVLRACLALIPGLASARPIKKWSAIGALIAAFGYLLLSGSEVATQRSFVMTAVVLIGVMADRPALTLRTLAIAAFAVLLLAPQSVVHPSFQMSFAATLALIAAYERGLPWMTAAAEPHGAPVWRCGAAVRWPRSFLRPWLQDWRQPLTQPSIFIGWRPMA
jgi:competence protein ComEC